MVNCINLIVEMCPRFVLGRENVPCVAEVVNRSLKADCTDFNLERTSQDNFAPRNSPLISLLLPKLEQTLHKQQEQHS